MSRTQEESGSGRRARARSTLPETPPPAVPRRRKTTRAAPEPLAEAGEVQVAPMAEHRDRMIAEAAYYRAEQRGFLGDDDIRRQDWLEAEAEIDRMLAGASPQPSRGNGGE